MNSPVWDVRLARSAAASYKATRGTDRRLLDRALEEMRADPFTGNIARLHAQPTAWRRTVGNWRLLFDVDATTRVVAIADIARRTTTTYRRR